MPLRKKKYILSRRCTKVRRRLLLRKVSARGFKSFDALWSFSDEKNLDLVKRFLTVVKKNSCLRGFVFFISVKLVGEGVRNLGRQIFFNVGFSAYDLLDIIKGRISEGLLVYQNDFTNHLIFRFCEFDCKKKRYRKVNVPLRMSKVLGGKEEVEWLSDLFMPLSMDEGSYGQCFIIKDEKWYVYKPDIMIKRVEVDKNRVECDVYGVTPEGTKIKRFTYVDECVGGGPLFRRYIKGSVYEISNGQLKKASIKLSETPKLEVVKECTLESSVRDLPIITMDIESYIEENTHIPYAIGWYIGGSYNYMRKNDLNVYYKTDFESPSAMIQKALFDLLCVKNHNHFVYLHNFDRFDSAYIVPELIKMSEKYDMKVKPLVNNGKLLEVQVLLELNEKVPEEHKKGARGGVSLKRIKITFRDSLKLLPGSLKELGGIFNVETQKGDFPYTFITVDTLNYIGPKPDIMFYPNIKKVDYDKICEPWSARKEALNYLRKDLLSLHQIMFSFRNKVFNKYHVKIEKYLTLPSFSFGVYRNLFMPENCDIRMTSGVIGRDIRKAYMGGIVEIFKAYGEDLVCLDVNSLYPYAMLNEMPTGHPMFIVNPELEESFGFFYADVYCPDSIKYPTLPVKDPKLGLLCQTGRWSGWYFSEELKDAVKRGYKIKLLHGYQYERTKGVFKEFVTHFYARKMKATGVDRLIAKLILNSLYGRFGLCPDKKSTTVLSNKELKQLLKTHEIFSITPINGELNLVNYRTEASEEICRATGEDYLEHLFNNMGNYEPFQAVNISAAIASYARMFMNDFKCDGLYYTDTDSIFVDRALADRFENIGPGLGQWKIEHKIEKAWFLAPKIYLLALKGGNYIKKFKGMSPDLVKVDDYMQLFSGGKVQTEMTKWFRFSTHVETVKTPLTIDPFYWDTKREKVIYMPSGEIRYVPRKFEQTADKHKKNEWVIKKTRLLKKASSKKAKVLNVLLLESLSSSQKPPLVESPSPNMLLLDAFALGSSMGHEPRGGEIEVNGCVVQKGLSKPFRLSARKVFLTFSNVERGVTQETICEKLQEKFRDKLRFIQTAKEPLLDNTVNFHILISFNKKMNIRNRHYFDFLFGCGGNYRTVPNEQAVIDFLSKFEDGRKLCWDS